MRRLKLTCCLAIASFPITSNTQSPKLYHKSEWIFPLKPVRKARALTRAHAKLDRRVQLSPQPPSRSLSAYQQHLPCLSGSAGGRTGRFFLPNARPRLHAVLPREESR